MSPCIEMKRPGKIYPRTSRDFLSMRAVASSWIDIAAAAAVQRHIHTIHSPLLSPAWQNHSGAHCIFFTFTYIKKLKVKYYYFCFIIVATFVYFKHNPSDILNFIWYVEKESRLKLYLLTGMNNEWNINFLQNRLLSKDFLETHLLIWCGLEVSYFFYPLHP